MLVGMAASTYGFDADFYVDLDHRTDDSDGNQMLYACVDHGARQLLVSFSTYPSDAAARARATRCSSTPWWPRGS